MSDNPYLDMLQSQQDEGLPPPGGTVAPAPTPTPAAPAPAASVPGPQPAAPATNPYLDLLKQDSQNDQGKAALAISTQTDVNPDRAAQNTQLARQFGVPPSVVDNWPDEFRQRAITDAARQALTQAPTLSSTLAADPRMASVIHDDVPVTAATEATARSFPARVADYLFSTEGYGANNLVTDIGNVLHAASASVEPVAVRYPALAAGAMLLPVDKLLGTNLSDYPFALAYSQQQLADMEKAREQGDQSFKGKLLTATGQTLGVLGEAMATGPEAIPARAGASGWEAIGAGVRHGVQSMAVPAAAAAHEAADQVQAAGGTDAEAVRAGLGAYLTSTLGGVVPFARQGAGLLSRIATGAVMGPLTGEVSRQVSNATMPDSLQQPAPGADDLLISALTGGVFGGMVHGEDVMDLQNRASALARASYSDAADAGRALQGEGVLRTLSELAQGGKLRARDPQAFQQLLSDVSDSANVDGVWIDAKRLAEVLDAGGADAQHLQDVLPKVADQMREGLQTEGQVRIGLDDYATHVMGGPLEEALIPHLRVDPDGPTIGEARQFEQTQREGLAGEAQKILDEKQADDEFKASRQQVVDNLRDQIAATKRYPADVSNLYAEHLGNFYTVLGQELGMQPHEAAERYPVSVSAERALGDTTMAQPAYHGSGARFDKFTTEKMGTGEGAQAYGWGMYFAGDKTVAKGYRDSLAMKVAHVNGEVPERGTDLWEAANSIASKGYDEALAQYRKSAEFKFLTPAGREQAKRVADLIESLKDAKIEDKQSGALYHVDVPDDTKLLDYDARLADQPDDVRAALDKLGFPAEVFRVGDNDYTTREEAQRAIRAGNLSAKITRRANTLTGKEIYEALSERLGSDKAASLALNEAGVPGLRYLDAGSRAAGEGSHNYVVFHDDAVNILKTFYQESRGEISFPNDLSQGSTISLYKDADLSTFLHESAHFFLQVYSDVASRPDAPTKIQGDMQKLLDWFGVKDNATWRAMSADEQRQFHEQFARGYEAHLMEGKAPAVGMQAMYERFRAWLVRTYQSLKALGVELTPEVRGVMDRMVASENAIREAEAVRGLRALFDQKPEGMTDDAWAKYQDDNAAATGEAVSDLQRKSIRDMRWMANAKSKAMKALQREARAQRKAITEEVTKEVAAMPAFAAKDFMRENASVDPEVVADKFGFGSADQMRAAIRDAGARKDAIEGMVDQRMLERHGELVDPAAIERAAEVAIHNDVRARVLARELNALAKATGSPRLLAKAAEEAARSAIGAKVVRELRPKQYPIAEGKAGRLAAEALKKGDTQTAAVQKRAQLLNNRLAKAAIDAADTVQRGLTYQGKFDRASIREKLDGEFLEQIDHLRAMVDFRRAPPAENKQLRSLAEFAKALRDQGYEPQVSDWLAGMKEPTSYKDLTVDQFRATIDAMRSLEAIARDRMKVRVAGQVASVRDVVDGQLLPRLEQRGEKFAKADLLDTPQAKVDGFWRTFTHWMGVKARMIHSDLLPTEDRFNRFDLHEINGPFRSILYDRFVEANYRKVDLTKAVTDKAGEVGKALGKDWQKSLYDILPNSTLMDPDLSTPDKPVPLKMTRGKLLRIAAHVGNESNFDKLTKGWGWQPEAVLAYLQDNMRAADWRATQAHWDSFDPLWKESEEMIRRIGGVPPPKVPAREFSVTTKDGETLHMRGGYSPIDYDPLRSKLSVRKGEFSLGPTDRVENMPRYTATTTSNGSLNARMEGYTDRVSLDFHGAEARIRDTIHDLAYREALLDASKIVNDGKFREAFMRAYGREEYQALTDWLRSIRDTTTGDPNHRAFEKAMQYTRQGVVLTGIGYRVSTVLKHGGAAALKSLGYLGNADGAKYFAARLARMGSGHAAEDIAAAREKFGEIRTRMLQMDRDYSEGTRSMYESEGWREKNDRFGHMMVAWSDALSAVPTAWAAYDLAITKGVPESMGGTGKPMTEAQAVAYANSIVRQAHGSALEVSRSNFMQSRGAKGLFGALYGFMNNTYGQMADLLDKSTSNGYFRNNPAVAARLFATLIVPALWTEWLKDHGPDKDESWLGWGAKAIGGEVAAMVPFVRDAVAMIEYGRNPSVAPVQAFSDVINSGKDLWKEAHGESSRIIQDLSNAVGEWGRIAGLGELGHILQHMRDVAEGKKEPSAWGAVVGGKEQKK